jgi:hypothetical protein
VHTWMIDNRPLFEDEEAFIYSVDDFIMARRSSSQGSLHGSKIAEQLEDWIAKQPRSGFRSWLHVCLCVTRGLSLFGGSSRTS